MYKNMFEVEIFVRKKLIVTQQPIMFQNNPAEVVLNPEQIDLLIKWLLESKREVLNGKNQNHKASILAR